MKKFSDFAAVSFESINAAASTFTHWTRTATPDVGCGEQKAEGAEEASLPPSHSPAASEAPGLCAPAPAATQGGTRCLTMPLDGERPNRAPIQRRAG